MSASDEATALNRVADGLFAVAKAQRDIAKAAEKQLEISRTMAEMQKANLAVTKALEAQLTLQTGNSHGSA
jgi:hypothetical protein